MNRVKAFFLQEKNQKIVIISLAVVVAVVSLYSFKSMQYAQRLLPNTKVNRINVGGLTINQANKKLNREFTEAAFDIRFDDTLWKQVKRSSLGWQKDHRNQLSEIKRQQNPFSWSLQLFTDSQYQLANSYDQSLVNQLTESLKTTVLQKNVTRTPTKNAAVEWDGKNFVVVPEQLGDTIDVEAVQSALIRNLEKGKHSVNAEAYYAQPILTSRDADLDKRKAEMNQLAEIKASYTINGTQVQIPAAEIRSWLATNEKAELLLKQDEVTAYVTEVNDAYNTKTNPTLFQSTRRGSVSVPAGIYNWSVDIPAEVEALKSQLLKGKDFNRVPIIDSEVPNIQTSIGSTYVEIDLQNQYMWYYKDGEVQFETDIVSGKPSTPTPPGVNYVTSKSTNQILRGLNDDGSKYASPVRYWMPIDQTGVGIHDSDWQSAYGGDLWLYRGSHGCINTPPAKMDELYPILEVGTPVLVF